MNCRVGRNSIAWFNLEAPRRNSGSEEGLIRISTPRQAIQNRLSTRSPGAIAELAEQIVLDDPRLRCVIRIGHEWCDLVVRLVPNDKHILHAHILLERTKGLLSHFLRCVPALNGLQ